MAYFRNFFLLIFIITSCFEAQGADKYTDQNRPYEFGFSIDGEQHRHEKKDENGIIMGEFGFITADGVYHVTVYATDENGNFKIISMKNIRVKPYPTSSASSDVRTGHSLSLPPQISGNKPASPSQNQASYSSSKSTTPQPIQVSSSSKPSFKNPIIEPARACSHCSLPTSTTIKPVYSQAVGDDISPNTHNDFSNFGGNNFESINANTNQEHSHSISSNSQAYKPQLNRINSANLPANVERNPSVNEDFDINNSQPPLNEIPQNYNSPISSSGFIQNQPSPNVEQNDNQNSIGSTLSQENNPQQFNSYQNSGNDNLSQQVGGGSKTNSNNAGSRYNDQNNPESVISNTGSEYNDNLQGERNPKQLDSFSQTLARQGGTIGQNEAGNFETSNFGKPVKPVLISAQMQIVDKNTDVNYKKPGEKDGLPNGLTKGDMENLLYTFNYTLAFHGHYEEGYTSGAKQGYYFVTGRNGVRTRIDYVADENGFRPKITQEVLDLISDDVPKPHTEKDEKYGLKGYEFKWLYFPVASNQR